MASWESLHSSVKLFGEYRGKTFHDVQISSLTMCALSMDRTGVSKRLWVQATDTSYDGKIPHSGSELLTWADVAAYSGTVELFGIAYGQLSEPTLVGKSILVLKGSLGIRSDQKLMSAAGVDYYGFGATLTVSVFKRVYSDATHYTEEQVGSKLTTPIYQNNARDVSVSEICPEFFYDGNQVYFGVSSRAYITALDRWYCNYNLRAPIMEDFATYFGDAKPEGEPYSPEYGPGSEPGGYDGGGYGEAINTPSDNIVKTNPPTLGASSPGFLNLYKISSAELSQLGEALFPAPAVPDVSQITDVQSGFGVLVDTLYTFIQNSWNGKLLDYVVDCHILPVDVPTSGTADISCGGKWLIHPGTNPPVKYNAATVSANYVTVSCGEIQIPLNYKNFMDFAGVRCKLYLPCYGFVDIPPEYWNGGHLAVSYDFNVIDGSFVACVYTTPHFGDVVYSLIGQYSGVAVTHIPIRGQDYSQVVSGIEASGAGIAAGIATGNFGMTAGAVVSGLSNLMAGKPGLVNNGSANSSSSMLMHKKPYLLIEYPTPQFSAKYPSERGLPLNTVAKLGAYKGFTVAEDPVLDGIPCTEREKERIRAALKSGLIFK